MKWGSEKTTVSQIDRHHEKVKTEYPLSSGMHSMDITAAQKCNDYVISHALLS